MALSIKNKVLHLAESPSPARNLKLSPAPSRRRSRRHYPMTNKTPCFVLIGFALLSALAVFAPRVLTDDTPSKNAKSAQVEATSSSAQIIKEIEPLKLKQISPLLNPALADVCSCESNGKRGLKPRQFEKDGSVVTGKINHLDKGACQINLHYHEKTATKMGLDLLTENGNITYANYLYKTQGLQPWSASSACWGSGFGTSSVRQ